MPVPSPGYFPNLGIEPGSPALWAGALPSKPFRAVELPRKPHSNIHYIEAVCDLLSWSSLLLFGGLQSLVPSPLTADHRQCTSPTVVKIMHFCAFSIFPVGETQYNLLLLAYVVIAFFSLCPFFISFMSINPFLRKAR